MNKETKEIVKGTKVITRRPNGTVRVVTKNDLPSRTQKQFGEQVNVNTIMAKYKKTGLIDHVRKQPGKYQDLTNLPDYMTAMQTVITANTTFETLPSEVRNRFNHDPAQLIEFLGNSKNYQEAVKLGLVIPIPEPEPPAPAKKAPKKEEPPE